MEQTLKSTKLRDCHVGVNEELIDKQTFLDTCRYLKLMVSHFCFYTHMYLNMQVLLGDFTQLYRSQAQTIDCNAIAEPFRISYRT